MFTLRITFLGLLVALVAGKQLPRPIRPRVTIRTTDTLKVEWTKPPLVAYARYTVTISPNGIIHQPQSPMVTNRVITGLLPGVEYSVEVRGQSENGALSPPMTFKAWTAPLAPVQLKLRPITEIKIEIQLGEFEETYSVATVGIHVDWEQPDGFTDITGYDIQINPQEGVLVFPQSNIIGESGSTSAVYTGLTPGKQYTVTVRAKTGSEREEIFSELVTATAKIPPNRPFSVEAKDVEATDFSLHVMRPAGANETISIHTTPNDVTISAPTPDPLLPKFDVYHISGLQPSTTYRVDVNTISHGVSSIEPYIVTLTTKSLPPTELHVTTFDSNSVTLQWKQPRQQLTGNQEIQYLIEYADHTDEYLSQTINAEHSSSFINARIQELESGKVYKFNVTTIVNGIESNPAQVIQATVPPTPVVASIAQIGDGISLTFIEPEDGECPVVKVMYSPGLNGNNPKPVYVNISSTAFLEGVPRSSGYSIHTRCVAAAIEGPELTFPASTVVYEDTAEGLEETARDEPPAPPPPGEGANARDAPPPPPPPGEGANSRDEQGGSTAMVRLECLALGLGTGRPRPAEFIAPDACCGNRPYHTISHTCCGRFLLGKVDDRRLCCGQTPYVTGSQKCCSPDVVVRSDVDC
uniref:fibronectin isoform X2 n=1 Tax=Ciona intestinalis TaxID=7719 RepID=UPI00089DBAF2|nr:fibronectin isoform X2 [Ciona intestinalis]|eukprot:XP_018669934.1 fibronectin isoform X2 [Ciona intestinalis]